MQRKRRGERACARSLLLRRPLPLYYYRVNTDGRGTARPRMCQVHVRQLFPAVTQIRPNYRASGAANAKEFAPIIGLWISGHHGC